MRGRDPQGARWTLGVADPRDERRLVARLFADGRCVATSSDAQVRFSADGRHHHILDPHTGDSPPALAGVTVAAADGALADALTKVFFVAGPSRAAEVARAWGVDALWIDKAGAWQASEGLALDARAT
jgi:thiamine biosynthesis lipoprotein